jgi:Na+/melibiose symporter-like transporter|eukprot:COSAG02_NODE_106_length_36326_cov_13.777266_4_plen_485_part_00
MVSADIQFVGAQFGSAMVSPWCAIIAVGGCREIYALKYHVDVGVVGTLHVLHGCLEILFSLAIGYMQDKEKFVFACFNKERWGRRAPWLLWHCPLMAVAMYCSWAPPSLEKNFLAGWYFVVVALGMWSWEQILIATQAGTVECYPYKEERVVVEACNVAFTAAGVSIAVVLIAVAFQFELSEHPEIRTVLGATCSGIGLLSLPSAFALRDARQLSNARAVPAFLDSIQEVMQNSAFRWLAAENVVSGIAGGTLTSFFLYYFTFVCRLTDSDISIFVVAIPVLGLVMQSVCAVFWGKFFASKRRTPRGWTVVGRVLDAAASFAIILNSTSIESFLLWFCVNRVAQSPRSFWSISARSWVIDEDAHRVEGRRRESVFTGVASAIGKVATLLGSALIAGQALAGIDTTRDRTFEQPAAGILYIRCMYMVVLPVLYLLQAYCIWQFPIKGARLERLEAQQARLFQAVSRDGGTKAKKRGASQRTSLYA